MKLETILSRDLLAYLCFQALKLFHEEYDIPDRKMKQSPYLASIFRFFLKTWIKDQLQSHGLQLEEEYCWQFSKEASAFLKGYTRGKSEQALSLYFDYISDWTKTVRDWNRERPMEYGRFEFA